MVLELAAILPVHWSRQQLSGKHPIAAAPPAETSKTVTKNIFI